jgi:hypothetical protein
MLTVTDRAAFEVAVFDVAIPLSISRSLSKRG